MEPSAWRTLIVGAGCRLSRDGAQLVLCRKEGTKELIPLFDLQAVVIASLQVSLTAHLICELQERNIRLVFCDEKSIPCVGILGLRPHHAATSRIVEQIAWKKRRCNEIWKHIIRLKIEMQQKLLSRLALPVDSERWLKLLKNTRAGDRSNREGLAARLYFKALFGESFIRRDGSTINAALNYGYAILCSAITRAVSAHGYHPGLGIHHRAGTNPLNFSYDLIEPFRPLVDLLVYSNPHEELSKELKHCLIDVTNLLILYQQKRMTVAAAIDQWVLDVTRSLNSNVLFQCRMDFEICEKP